MLTSYAQLSITYEQHKTKTDWFNFLAAFIGSVASTLVMHPLDTIKTRLQVSGGTSSGSGSGKSDDKEEEEVDEVDAKDIDKQDDTNNNSEQRKEEAPIIATRKKFC